MKKILKFCIKYFVDYNYFVFLPMKSNNIKIFYYGIRI